MIAKKQSTTKSLNVCLILDNIRSVHNVGSIFRTAETLGINYIYCVGTTPTPEDRFGRKRSDFGKVALGAEDIIKWEHISEATSLLKKLKKEGLKIIALEQSPKSIDYKDVKVGGVTKGAGGATGSGSLRKIAVILGNEVDGVSSKMLKYADVIAEIPMLGKKESLNVSVAGAVFLFRLLDK